MRLSWIRFSVVLSLLLIRPRPDDSYCRIHTHTHSWVSAPCTPWSLLEHTLQQTVKSRTHKHTATSALVSRCRRRKNLNFLLLVDFDPKEGGSNWEEQTSKSDNHTGYSRWRTRGKRGGWRGWKHSKLNIHMLLKSLSDALDVTWESKSRTPEGFQINHTSDD